MKNIKDYNFEQLKQELISLGEKAFRAEQIFKWQHWMYKNAYVVPTTGTYSITAVNLKITGWSLKPSADVWYEAGFSKN